MCSFIRKTQKKKKKKLPAARFFSRLPSLGFFVFVNLLFSPNSNPEYISGNKINKSNKKPERIFFILCIKNVFFNQNADDVASITPTRIISERERQN